MTKDAWIQLVKATLYDAIYDVESASLRDEIRLLIFQGGGYDPCFEDATTRLRWPEGSSDVEPL